MNSRFNLEVGWFSDLVPLTSEVKILAFHDGRRDEARFFQTSSKMSATLFERDATGGCVLSSEFPFKHQ